MLFFLGELVAALVLAAWQAAWVPALRLGGQPPELVLILVVLVGLFRGPTKGAWAGQWGALCWGGLSGALLGGLFVTTIGCGVATGLLGQEVFSDRLPVLMVIVFVAVLAAGLVGLIFAPPPAFAPWLVGTLGRAALSAVMTIPLTWVARCTLCRAPSLTTGLRPGSVLSGRG